MRTSDVVRLVPLVTLIGLTAACAAAPAAAPKPDESAIRAAITAEMAKFNPVFERKDAAAVAKLFTEDGTWILPDATSYSGRANIEAGAKKFFASFESATGDPMVIDRLIVVSDSEAVTFSHGTGTMTEPGKPPARFLNPFADYWKKGTDGTWRVAYEVNAQGPAPGSEPAKP